MAKPNNWADMSDHERQEVAVRLAATIRGKLIMGQALALAIKKLKEVEPPVMREQSNIEDMEMLGEQLFQPWYAMYDRPSHPMIEDEVEL